MSRTPKGALMLVALSILLGLIFSSPGCIGQERDLSSIRLPEGFRIEVYADQVPDARSLALGSNGTVFVGSRSAGNVYALVDLDDDGKSDRTITIASGLDTPNGVAFKNGSLFVAEIDRVIRYDGIESRLENPPSPVVVKEGLPSESAHGWKVIRFGPDEKLYIAIGAPCNICEPVEPQGTISRMNPDGSQFEVYARGIRNSVGFDWSPTTGELWFTDNGRDWLGNDVPSDELNRAPEPGMDFGFPYCHAGNISDPQYGQEHSCSEFVSPEALLGAHVAALGMRFYTGPQFPEEYLGQIFIAEHGSWNRDLPIGYRVVLARIENGTVHTETFADGWLQGSSAWGRPVDVQVMPDGALLVSDDSADAVYRISYGQLEQQKS